jgi:ABC-type multidrug transport system permease subunit
VYAVAAAFGVVALMAGSFAKLVALVALMALMAAAIGTLILISWFKRRKLLPK